MEEENNSEAEVIPKKISLLVPTLKIKSSTSESDSQNSSQKEPENEKPKKIKRPMPASMRKKLEESKQTEDEESVEQPASPADSSNDGDNANGDPVNVEESGGSGPPPKRLSRPMPASARKKLESKPKDDSSSERDEKVSDTDAGDEAQENGETIERDDNEPASTKKGARPMPASARRKLNGSNHVEESHNGDSTSETGSTGGARLKEDSHKKRARPGPSSVRRKLEESSDHSKLSDVSDAESEWADEATNESEMLKSLSDDEDTPKIKKRPMGPASAKRKLQGPESREKSQSSEDEEEKEQNGQEDRDSNSSDTTATAISVSKPMPASARKKLEGATDDDDAKSISGSETKTDHHDKIDHDPPKKSKRPMPASMKRKLKEAANEDNATDKVKSDTEDEGNDPPESPQSMPPAVSETKSLADDDENSQGSSSMSMEKTETDENLETKKINISLGGIKFPTFKKPMPASVQKKLEHKQKEERAEEKEQMDTDPTDDGQENQEDKGQDESSGSSRRGRSSKSISSRELQSLVDEKFQCQYCDYETYSSYAKKKHEESHFKVKEDQDPVDKPKRDSSKSKTSKKVVKKEFKYKGFCPYCDRRINHQRKLSKHVTSCGHRRKLKCKICNIQFRKVADFQAHNEQLHSGSQDESANISQENNDDDENTNLDQSPPASPCNSSVKSKSSVSNKSEARERKENQIEEPLSNQRSKTVDSFKRKIADVLGNLGLKNQKKRKLESDEWEDQSESDKDETPPKQKTVLAQSGKEKTESIRSLAMPASVRKKLEERKKDDKTASSEGLKDLHDLECEVCHRVFTNLCNRQRHERNVHSMKNPRGYGPSVTSSAVDVQESEPAAISSRDNRPTSKSKLKIKSKTLTLEDIPQQGKCPICSKFISQRLRRHAKDVHKIPSRTNGTNISSSSAPASAKTNRVVVRPSAPKSYKIYRSAADKAKKKLVHQPTSPVKQPPTSTNRMSSIAQAVVKTSKDTKPTTVERKPARPAALSAPAIPTDMKCACCDEIFTVKIDFNEHMTRRHPKMKRLITCKLCMHMFTHEEDFILHIQFRHKELVSGMVKQEQPHSKKVQNLPDASRRSLPTNASTSKSTNHTSAQNTSSSRRSLRGAANSTNFEDFNSAAAESCPKVTINISSADKWAADTAIRQSRNPFNNTSRSSRRAPSPASDPEPMDTYYDDGPASPAGGDESMEIEDSGIAITATFSQRTSPRKSAGPASTKDDMNKMPCSSCSEVFYSFEALRKHELYFHNTKTSKMCPICGVYPTRLSRHLLAHEYKTVRCSCAPCRLDFTSFDLLLKHNLEHHPGPDGGGASSSASKQITAEKDSDYRVSSSSKTDEVFRCKLCKREVTGGSHARRHVRRSHPECEEDPEKFLEKVGGPIEPDEEDMDIGNILEDTNKKLLDSDWEDDTPASPIPVSKPSSIASHKKPKRPMPASIRAKLAAKKEPSDIIITSSSTITIEKKTTSSEPKVVKRAMPASMRAKLEAKKRPNDEGSSTSAKHMQDEPNPKPVVKRAMPASIRAKLAKHKNDDEEPAAASTPLPTIKAKPGKPMPASMRAKFMSKSHSSSGSVISDTVSNSSKISSSVEKPKPKRPMPASMRARMLNKAELKEVTPSRPPRPIETYSPTASPEPISYNDDSNRSYSRPGSKSRVEHGRRRDTSSEVVTLDDDDDDLAVVAVIEDSVPIPVSSGGLAFNIADEIAEHNKTVQVVTIGDATASGSRSLARIYKCKLCQRTFDSGENIRRHIQLEHDEYGPEHMENLIETIYQESVPEVSRKRRSNVNYHKSYRVDDDDAEEEVIVSRGTSTRPRGSSFVPPPTFSHHTEVASSPAISHSVEHMDSNLLMYACKFCGKRMDSPGNVKRHISKSHSSLKGLYEDDVVLLEPGREHEFVPMKKEAPQKIIPPVVVTAATSSQLQTVAPVQFPPPVSYKCRICQKTMEKRMSVLLHIHRSHPEVKTSEGKDVSKFVQDVYENNLLNNALLDVESPGETYSCGFCSFQTTDEHDYVRHYKKHTGVSPYHCQYCAATFNRQQQLTAHITREHTGAEFLNEDEAEISMEEMVGVGEISVSTAARIQIDHPKVITLNRRFSTSENILPESTSPNADFVETTEDHSTSEQEQVEPESTNNGDEAGGEDPISNNDGDDNANDNEPESEQPEETASFPMPYQGDLSSLFPTLGGSEALGSLADTDMDLD